MKLRTELEPLSYPFQLLPGQPLLAMGSCWATAMGNQLAQHGFPVLNNPFGTLFNPISLGLLLQLHDAESLRPMLLEREGQWYCYQCHSQLHASSPAALLQAIASQAQATQAALASSQALLLTLGTSLVWHHQQLHTTVANCHKMPGHLFQQQQLAVHQVVAALQPALQQAQARNPGLQVLLSVSPVRHTRQGLQRNSLSKAVLRLACQQLADELPWCHYFPAYELLVDDLRDYRFYAEDMVHPSPLATQLVWQRFAQALIAPQHWPTLQAHAAQHRRGQHRQRD